MENIVMYAHANNLVRLKSILELQFGKIKEEQSGAITTWSVVTDKSLLSKGKTLTFNIRQRVKPDYQLTEIVDDVTKNLAGLCQLVNQIPTDNMDLKTAVLAKIGSINSEIAVLANPGFIEKFKTTFDLISQALDVITFSGKNSLFPNADGQGIYNKDKELLLDFKGNSNYTNFEINIDGSFFEDEHPITQVGNATERQLVRKQTAEKILEQCNIKVNYNLPCIADANEVTLQTKDAVVDRTLALFACALKAEGLEQENVLKFIHDFNVESKLSPQETEFIQNINPEEQDRINFLWRYESLATLMWSLGFFEEMSYPSEICDVPFIAKTIFESGESAFRAKANLKEVNEILDQMDLAYRCHWAVVDARLKNEEPSGGINPSIVFERHYAFNWLTRYMNYEWDAVQTHT